MLLGTMTVILVEGECPQYGSMDNSCTDNLPSLASPLAGGSLSQKAIRGSFFGDSWPRTYCNNLPKKHVGIDLRANFNEPVYAAYDGTVTRVRPSSSWCTNWGSTIIIDHSGLFTTIYEHVDPEQQITAGSEVKKSDIIGRIAEIAKIPDRSKASDCDTVNHLHFGIRCGGDSDICLRGALPDKNGDSDYDPNTGKFTGCKCDPLFPGGFINPLDSRIIYEEPAAVMAATIGIPPMIDQKNLKQLGQNDDTITVGKRITYTTVAFRAILSHPTGKNVKLQVELRRLDEYDGNFIDSEGHEEDFKNSELVTSGSSAIAYAYGLIDGNYHWRARAVGEDGTTSEWVDFGGNDVSEADFTVSAAQTNGVVTPKTLMAVVSLESGQDSESCVVGRWNVDVTAKLPNGEVRATTNGDIMGFAMIFHNDGTYISLGPYNEAGDLNEKSSGTWVQNGNALSIQEDDGTIFEGTITANAIELEGLYNGIRIYWSLEKIDCQYPANGWCEEVCMYGPVP